MDQAGPTWLKKADMGHLSMAAQSPVFYNSDVFWHWHTVQHITFMQDNDSIKVWDLPVRLFHWLVAGLFVFSWYIEGDWLDAHVFSGYAIGALVLLRVVWGVIGSRRARFSDFLYPPRAVIGYLRDMFIADPKRYQGHNPAGGAMVVAMLVVLALTVITGLAAYGASEMDGPLVGLFYDAPDSIGVVTEEIHEWFVDSMLLLIALHLAGVLLASWQHRENLVRAMFTGNKRAE